MIVVDTKTATKSKSGKIYAFGRNDDLNGKPVFLGGYYVFRLCENYDGKARTGTTKTWRYVGAQNLSYEAAVALMNKKCGYIAFNAK
jgi:hypothetical protein